MTDNVLQTVVSVVRPFLPPHTELTADTPLAEIDGLDSGSMVNILLELESRLGFQLNAADLTFDHFQSCRVLAERLNQRLQQP